MGKELRKEASRAASSLVRLAPPQVLEHEKAYSTDRCSTPVIKQQTAGSKEELNASPSRTSTHNHACVLACGRCEVVAGDSRTATLLKVTPTAHALRPPLLNVIPVAMRRARVRVVGGTSNDCRRHENNANVTFREAHDATSDRKETQGEAGVQMVAKVEWTFGGGHG